VVVFSYCSKEIRYAKYFICIIIKLYKIYKAINFFSFTFNPLYILPVHYRQNILYIRMHSK
jgi:hypothetical protein